MTGVKLRRLTHCTGLPANISIPEYKPEAHHVGIVHFGIGAFHRGHMAVYTDDVMAADGGDWRITGISLRSPGVRDRLAPQNGLFTLVERSEKGESFRIIGSIKEILVAPEDPAEVFQRLLAPTTRIVSMTITEKGYLRDPASGALMHAHPDIQHDLAHPEQPRTMHGFVTAALDQIRKSGAMPFALLSCDNLPANGSSLQRVILEFAQQRSRSLRDWINSEVSFPNTMVDRIVPAITPQGITAVSEALGRIDEAPVICEPFTQWVIEDCLPEPRPAWEKFGARFAADVAPYEEMKLRLLNGSHSALAYLGYLGGFEYMHQVIADPDYLAFIKTMMREEVVPTLNMPSDIDLNAYCEILVERFSNPTLCHRTGQIAMDGSLKIPQRLLDPVRDRIAAAQPYAHLALAIAAWLRYITGLDEKGNAIDVSDPFAKTLRAIADQHADDIAQYVRAILQVREIFGSDLPADENFRSEITLALENLYRKGAKEALIGLTRI